MWIGDNGITAIKQPQANKRPNARIGGGMSGGLRRTVGEKYYGFQTSIYVYMVSMSVASTRLLAL